MANQLAIYKHGLGFELGATEKQIQVVDRTGLEVTWDRQIASWMLTTTQGFH